MSSASDSRTLDAGRGIVVCSILEPDAASTARRLASAPAGCGLVEIRADCLSADEVRTLVRGAGRPVIVRVARAADGGQFTGSEREREGILRGALEAGAHFVDVELGGELRHLTEGETAARVILSHHTAVTAESELQALYREMARSGASRLKLVPAAGRVEEAGVLRRLLDDARREGRALACFASGRAGAVSRLLALSWDSWATYGSAARGAETADGQFPAAELLETHDVTRIGPRTRRFALVGSRVFASPSPALHAAAHRAAGHDARLLPVELDRFEECLALGGPEGVLGLSGLAVTMPFKEEAAARCVRLDSIARQSGAVNTVLFQGDGWTGFNTDGPAVRELLAAHLELRGSAVAILGAGGTARAAAAALGEAGARVTLFNRTAERAARAAAALGVAWQPLEGLRAFRWDALVQVTPLGSRGERALEPGQLTGRVVLDAVYGAPTPLVRDAAARGLVAVDGFELLVEQAVLQIDRMTGVAPDRALLRRLRA